MKSVAYSFGLTATLLLSFFFVVVLSPSLCKAELLDRVVAVVNDDVITLSELEKEGAKFFRDISAKAPAENLAETLEKAREEVLNRIIENRLIAQKAKADKISVSEDEVENAFQQMQQQSGLSAADFLGKIKEEGMTESVYKEQLRQQVLQGKLVSADVRAKVAVTDDEILDYYDTHYTSQVSKGGLYLLQIGLVWRDPKNPDASDEVLRVNKLEARRKAEEVRQLAKKGEDFKSLARKYSDLPSAADGGDIGVFQLHEMASYMQGAVKELQPGGISEIIETPEGYQFFKLLNNQDGTIVIKTPLEQVKEEIRNTLYEERLKKAYDEWFNNLKNQAYIQKL